VKISAAIAVSRCSDKIDAFLGNLQFGLRKGGAEHIAHTAGHSLGLVVNQNSANSYCRPFPWSCSESKLRKLLLQAIPLVL
jgi:hypothetical protein